MIETEFKYFYKYFLELLGFKKKSLKGDTKYLFIHIPKTAGTSFLFSLYDCFDYQNIYPNFLDYINPKGSKYSNTKRFVANQDKILTDNIKIISGHLHFNIKDLLKSEDVKIMVFFRDPLKRIVSDISYLKTNPKSKFMHLSSQELLKKNNNQMYRKQATLMGYDSDSDNISKAMQNLSNCDFVGITEQYEKSIRLCNAIFGWSLNVKMLKNRAKKSNYKNNKSIINLIDRHLLKADQMIYNAAIKRFESLCDQYGIK